ncbi:hypothetical protein [Pseudenhygromyxa sp. WMMC2535]|uniref:hypothetical protein n=1 Tax=Pseudenhygromyxa sp. WMMC2535 TaxID=2712867 RepID=UPI001C3D9D47|nr:hypothetical protein [Pseudenhygromyxa sp. WMMC2535]
MTTQIKVSLLLTAGIALVGCDKSFEDYGDLEYVEDDSMQLADRDDDEDGEWLEAFRVRRARETIDNHAPCGEQTLLTVHATSGATYVFCGLGDGMTGVLEELPADGRADSLIDLYATPTELLHAVTPEDEKVPSEIVTAVERGELDSGGRAPRRSRGRDQSAAGACGHWLLLGRARLQQQYGWLNSFLPFIEEFVADQSACENHIWYTNTKLSMGRAPADRELLSGLRRVRSAPWSGACAAKSMSVLRWRHLVRGAEERRLGLVVVHLAQLLGLRGSVATWKMYANSAKSCAGTADRDNMRFTGTASQAHTTTTKRSSSSGWKAASSLSDVEQPGRRQARTISSGVCSLLRSRAPPVGHLKKIDPVVIWRLPSEPREHDDQATRALHPAHDWRRPDRL